MSHRLKLKLILIIFFLIGSLCFYEELFTMGTETIYDYDVTLSFITALCFGVIFTIALYNLFLFAYTKLKQYLYHGLAQLSVVLFLVNLDSLYIAPFDEIFGFKSLMLFGLSQVFILIFSLLFLHEFFKSYQIKQEYPMIKTILYMAFIDLLLTLIFEQNILTKLLPIFVFIWLILSEADYLLNKRDTPFNLILIGWYSVLFVVVIEYLGFIHFTGIIFPFMHVAFALESILLSIAISYKFNLLEEQNKLQQTLLYQKARLANMGELISMIAHQWRQPLHFISFSLMNLKHDINGNVKGQENIQKIQKQLKYMSHTIESFRNFYNPAKARRRFSVAEACHNSYTIVKSTLEREEIEIKIETIKDMTFYGNQNEFEQVILNLINNAKDAHIKHKTVDANISITIKKPTIIILDNAGGIDQSHLNKIFDPYFTTKLDSDGIGLYLVKKIIEEEFQSTINVESIYLGVKFVITHKNDRGQK